MRNFVISIMFVISLVACSHKDVKLQPIPQDGVILAFGDSLTAGVGASADTSYPTILEQISGYKVINAGVSGETTDGGLQRFAQILDNTKPNLVILMEGGNDILQSKDLKTTEQNLIAMINEAKSRNIQVMLIGIPAKNLLSPKTADFYTVIAKQTGVLYDGDTIAKLIKKNELKSDLVHFNADGYKMIADTFHHELQKSGALK